MILFILFISLILSSSEPITSQANEGYNSIQQYGELLVGIKTNAPASQDPFTYEYQENLELQADFFDFTNINNVLISFEISARASILFETGELRYSIEKTVNSIDIPIDLQSIRFENQIIQIDNQNIENQIIQFTPSDNTDITFNFQALIPNIQLQQLANPAAITFSSFQPQQYQGDIGNIDFWEEIILPLFEVDTIILPIVALGAAYHILQQQTSEVKSSIDQQMEEASELIADNEEVITAVRTAKEVVEFTGDVSKVNQVVSKDKEKNWLSTVGKFLLALYLFLLSTIIILNFLKNSDNAIELFTTIYLYYTAILLPLVLLRSLISFFKKSVLGQVGRLVPIVHPLFGILSLFIFVIFPFAYLINTMEINTPEVVRDFIVLSFISAGFVITALFAGYYLAKSGISWSKLIYSILTRLKSPETLKTIIIRVFTILYIGIILIKLTKTIALILTVLLENQYSTNAYLVNLAASYLQEEMIGPVILVYGLILIFFVQTLMAIFLHINEKEVAEEEDRIIVSNSYRTFSFFLLISTLSFLHLILLYQGKLIELGIASQVNTNEGVNAIDVWNLIFLIPPFRVLLDILLALGLIVALPFSIYEMWKLSKTRENQ